MSAAPHRPCEKGWRRPTSVRRRSHRRPQIVVATCDRQGIDRTRPRWMRRLACGSEEDGYCDGNTEIAYQGEQESGHSFLHIARIKPLNGGSVVQKCSTCCLFAWRERRAIGNSEGGSRLRADTPASIVPALFP